MTSHPDLGWEPISTAPKDGTSLLLLDPAVPEVTIGSFDSDEDRWGDATARGFPIEPTLWMSLDALLELAVATPTQSGGSVNE